MRRMIVAAAVAAVVGMNAAPASAAQPSGAVTTDCRVHMQGTWATGERFNAELQPGLVRPFGRGPAMHRTPDGVTLHLKAETLLCRRDGGRVPDHGGANIADFTGHGTMRRDGEAPMRVAFQAHVEDRGEGEHNAEDYFAVRAVDPVTGDEIYFNANYLASGTVKLIPV